MKVEKKELQPQLIEVTVSVDAQDYAEVERKRTEQVRKNADLKGFRKGYAPVGLIKKMYGTEILGESVNKVVGEALDNYLKENKMHVLGDPLPCEDQADNEWVSGNNFVFKFEVCLSPEINFEPGKDDVVNQYTVTVSAKEKTETQKRFKEYYDKAKENNPEAETKTDDQIKDEVEKNLAEQYKSAAEYRLNEDIRKHFVEKAAMNLPEDFLKRWLFAANDGKFTKEEIDNQFDGFQKDLKWQIVRGYLMNKFDFKIEKEDIEAMAASYVRSQYAMYGLPEVPDELLKGAVENMLQNREQLSRIVESAEDKKVIDKLREVITVKAAKITSEKFNAAQ